MDKTDAELLGVAHASCPLTVMRPLITLAWMNQTLPFISTQDALQVFLNHLTPNPEP